MGYLNEHMEPLKKEFPNCLANVECGGDCPPGWVGVVKEALPILEASGCKVVQVKQKFAGLRLYFSYPNDMPLFHYIAANMAVRLAESKAWKVCEECGEGPASIVGKSWAYTLCTSCADKFANKLK